MPTHPVGIGEAGCVGQHALHSRAKQYLLWATIRVASRYFELTLACKLIFFTLEMDMVSLAVTVRMVGAMQLLE